MNQDESIMGGEDTESVRQAMIIMIVWILVVVAAGVLLVLFRDAFTGVFTLLGLF